MNSSCISRLLELKELAFSCKTALRWTAKRHHLLRPTPQAIILSVTVQLLQTGPERSKHHKY